jgi:hypothetical protein
VDFGAKIGERLTYVLIEPPHACLVGSHPSSRLRRVVYKVVCKQFREDFKSTFALNFLGVATHNRFRVIMD